MDQDWTPVVFKSKKKEQPKSTDIVPKIYIEGKNTINSKKIEDEDYKMPKISLSLKTSIQQARQKKGLTQKQLAEKCSMTESTIKSYENGTCTPNSNELIKISKVLGTTLKNA